MVWSRSQLSNQDGGATRFFHMCLELDWGCQCCKNAGLSWLKVGA
jgi:hypothetical protein